MTQRDLSGFVKASEVARLLGVSPRTLARWSDNGQAPAPVRIGPGNRRFYRRADVESLLRNGASE